MSCCLLDKFHFNRYILVDHFELAICFRELLIVAGTGAVSRFVSENEQGQSDINTVSLTHVETVVCLERRT